MKCNIFMKLLSILLSIPQAWRLHCRTLKRCRSSGFTLVELLTVAVIIGILSYAAVVKLHKITENSKREAATNTVKIIATANRLRGNEGKGFADVGVLVSERYMSPNDLPGKSYYTYKGYDPMVSPCLVAQAVRKTSGPDGTGKAPYNTYGVCANKLGEVRQFEGAGGCPLCPSACTPDGSCSAEPACGETASGVDNCGNICNKTGAACGCTPDGSCTASPACGETASGKDNCGNDCTKTGPACPPMCTPDGSCNAAVPACGTTTTGTDNCGNSCTKTGADCPPVGCTPDGSCSAAEPACGKTTTGKDNCANDCTKTGADCPPVVCTPNGSCDAAEPACGKTTSGKDNCGNTCTKTGAVCCRAEGTCSAAEPACGETTSGVDKCGGPCTKKGQDCCVPIKDACSVVSVSCWTKSWGLDNCGNACSVDYRNGPHCCISNGSCDAETPACGETTSGLDNCDRVCTKTGPECPPSPPSGGGGGGGGPCSGPDEGSGGADVADEGGGPCSKLEYAD